MSFGAVPRLWRIVLVCSLVLNLLVLGIVVGAAFDHDRPWDRRGRVAGPMGPLVWALPDEDRQAMIQRLQVGPRDRGARRARFEALLSAVRADPFDPEALAQMFAEQRRRGSLELARAESALIEVLTDMTPAERSTFAQSLSDRMRRR
ncbi:periplasmic heavy metal sensor [Palleronia abyssalis]|uniref:Zinc resistance-associated protein n=1 Tax=Palleronia abyssalis TaxID=1501240 RepID=A0A2R8BS89_9RHOB|nr:periplasmic heavy metal sensor [Palleronia abyssalis]SPJ23012.1 hypothetical protein PAA8504_00816 [Palleronia abyssalis]